MPLVARKSSFAVDHRMLIECKVDPAENHLSVSWSVDQLAETFCLHSLCTAQNGCFKNGASADQQILDFLLLPSELSIVRFIFLVRSKISLHPVIAFRWFFCFSWLKSTRVGDDIVWARFYWFWPLSSTRMKASQWHEGVFDLAGELLNSIIVRSSWSLSFFSCL